MSQIILDKNKAIFLRMGTNILKTSAMCSWNGKLVIGCGEDATAQPNLLYFDESRYQEKGVITGGSAANNTISSEHRSKNFGADYPDFQKRLTSVAVVYQDNTAWLGSSNHTFVLQYRIDDGDWTTIATVTLGSSDKITSKSYDFASLLGYFFQFRITSDYQFEVLGYLPYFELETKRQQT